MPSPQVDPCLGRACAIDLMAEYGGRFVGAGCLISTLGSSHSFAGIFSLDESFAVTSFFFVAGFCVLMRIPAPLSQVCFGTLFPLSAARSG